MDRNYIDIHLAIDRYLQASLTNDEKAAFEERLIWDQSLLDELDLAEHLRGGLSDTVATDKFVGTRADAGIFRRLSSLASVPLYAAAASFLLAVTLTAGVLLSPPMSGDDSSGAGATRTEIVPLLVVRSGATQTIAVNEKSWTVLLVDVTGPYRSYRVSVRKDDSGAEPFWTQDGLFPTYPDALAIGMPGNALAAGSYVLNIEAVRDAGGTNYEHIQDLHFQTAAVE